MHWFLFFIHTLFSHSTFRNILDKTNKVDKQKLPSCKSMGTYIDIICVRNEFVYFESAIILEESVSSLVKLSVGCSNNLFMLNYSYFLLVLRIEWDVSSLG